MTMTNMTMTKDLTPNLEPELKINSVRNTTPNIKAGMIADLKIQQIKRELAAKMPGAFCNAENLKRPQGFPTGSAQLDSFLEGGGLPQGSLTLLSGALGMGATSLWIESAAFALKEKKWVAWVSRDVPLMPVSLQQKGMNLGHFVAVESPLKKIDLSNENGAENLTGTTSGDDKNRIANSDSSPAPSPLVGVLTGALNDRSSSDLGPDAPDSNEVQNEVQLDTCPELNRFPGAQIDGSIPSLEAAVPTKTGSFESKKKDRSKEKLAWLLQELMSSGLFDLIGCDLGEEQLRIQDLRKLQTQARDANIALVFLTRRPPPKGASASLFSLILKFERRRILIERALHRPTPQSFPRSVSYDRFTLHTADRIGTRSIPEANIKEREPHSLSQTS